MPEKNFLYLPDTPQENANSILFIDPGNLCGYAIFNTETKELLSGSLELKKYHKDIVNKDKRFQTFFNWLTKNNQKNLLKEIYFEESIKQKGAGASHSYGGYKAILELFCIINDIQLNGVFIQHWKKSLTGRGNASKEEIHYHVLSALGIKLQTQDHADALGLYIHWMRTQEQEP